MNTQTALFGTLLIGLLSVLVYLATQGSVIPIIILAVVVTILVFISGALLAILVVKTMNDRAQQQFADNAQENLAIMNQLQSVQNKQSQNLIRNLDQVNRLPNNNDYQPVFDIPGDLFEEIE